MNSFLNRKSMKSKINLFILIFLSVSVSLRVTGQNGKRKAWNTANPFKTNVFVENLGQFNNWANFPETVKYGINSANKIFFGQNSVYYRVDKGKILTEKQLEKAERHDMEFDNKEQTKFLVSMQWIGANPDAIIEAEGKSKGYYTFGEDGCWDKQAKGYDKLIYKNLYPNIDVEYIIPDKGGVKYSLILHPGADLSKVKMSYSGDYKRISLDDDGNIVIKTEAGDIIDHAPQSFMQGTGTLLKSSFVLKDNIVTFSLADYDNSSTAVIDPWTISPAQLVTDLAAYDVDYDKYGNVYVSGGSPPYKTVKYNAAGNWLWTFTNPAGFASNGSYSFYSKFCVLHHSGSIFIGEGLQGSGPRILKINSSGNLVITSANFSGNNECWTMFYNACTEQLIGFGGGTSATLNLQQINDTMLTGATIKSFNGYPGFCCNDITSAEMDYNGDFYALMSCYGNNTGSDGKLQKSLLSNNYNPPCAWDMPTGYLFEECFNYGIPGFGGIVETVRSNAVALNTSYVFTYDGKTLMAWDKNNGSNLGSIVVNASYASGSYRTHEGIAADECNNVYVGGTGLIHSYWFTGSSFIPGSSITNGITGEVYELAVDGPNNLIYASGAGFLAVNDAFFCPVADILQVSDTVNSCTGYACVSVSGGIPPYTYTWSNGGGNVNCKNNLAPGTYYVTITDNSCILQAGYDTIVITGNVVVDITGDTLICAGDPTTLTASGALTYNWAPSTGLSSTSGATVVATPSTTITYTVTGFGSGCSNSEDIVISVITQPTVNLGNDTSLCGSPTILLDAKNPGADYFWSTGDSTQTIIADTAGTYWVQIAYGSCVTSDTIVIFSNIPPNVNIGSDTSLCPGDLILLDAKNPGASYLWSTGATTQTISAMGPATLWVRVSVGTCVDNDTITLSVPTGFELGGEQSLCSLSEVMIMVNKPATRYQWSTGDTTVFIIVDTAGVYWARAMISNCWFSDTTLVTGGPTALWAPNTFTPNSDGLNEFFAPVGEGIVDANLKIFTRWGEMVYETDDLSKGWDGHCDGIMSQIDVYVWVLDYRTICSGDKFLREFGTVTLLK